MTGKNQETVFKALMDIKRSLPFPLLGIDSDNGSEFINGHLFRYCKKEEIAFTRSRPYNKNDGCHVEEKNWSRVRKNVGYDRFEGKEAAFALNRYYSLLCDYFNYFIPSMKLESKERKGKKTLRKHETPKIPIDKVLGCAEGCGASLLGGGGKGALQKKRLSLNPVTMMKEMKELKERIGKIAIPYGRS